MSFQILLKLFFLACVSTWSCQGKAVDQIESVEQNEGPLTLTVNKDGSYSIMIDGNLWFKNDDTFFTIGNKKYSMNDGTLSVVSGPTMSDGQSDQLGDYKQIELMWEATDSAKTRIITSFQVYSDHPAIVFSQNYTMGAVMGSSVGIASSLCTCFPSFTVAKDRMDNLGYLTFDQLFLRYQEIGNWNYQEKVISSDLYSAPLTFFNKTGHSVVLSSFREFMVSSMFHVKTNDAIQQGIMGKIKEIPQGFMHQTVLYFGSGIKQTIYNWGHMLLKEYKTERFTEHDVTLKKIGYWTDGGAFYYYNTVPNTSYEQTMLDIKADADKTFVPYKYYQIDSWWYFKGLGDGVKNWTAMPSIFPDGSHYLYQKLGYPIAAHNRYWSSNTDYAKENGGKYNFIVEKLNQKAIPQDKTFWNFLLKSSKDDWGLILYEQDWLNDEFAEMDATLENVTVAKEWLLDMGYGAKMNDLPIQYCMPMARHLLNSVLVPHVTQARASDDYHPGNGQWNIGLTSIIHHALDIRPFKDNFRTSSANEHHPKYRSEPVPELQTVIAMYSTGPVGPSDKIGFINVTLLNRTMSSGGDLLMPSQPMMAVDGYMLNLAFIKDHIGVDGLVWSTYSNVSNHIFGAILSITVISPMKVTPIDVDLGMIGPSYVYLDEHPETLVAFADMNMLTLGPSTIYNFQLYHTAPVLMFNNESWVILGEVEKLVPFSPKRFESLDVFAHAIRMELNTGPRETISLTIKTGKEVMWKANCYFKLEGRMVIELQGINKFSCIIPKQ